MISYHVASVYPIAVHMAKEVALGKAIEGIAWLDRRQICGRVTNRPPAGHSGRVTGYSSITAPFTLVWGVWNTSARTDYGANLLAISIHSELPHSGLGSAAARAKVHSCSRSTSTSTSSPRRLTMPLGSA